MWTDTQDRWRDCTDQRLSLRMLAVLIIDTVSSQGHSPSQSLQSNVMRCLRPHEKNVLIGLGLDRRKTKTRIKRYSHRVVPVHPQRDGIGPGTVNSPGRELPAEHAAKAFSTCGWRENDPAEMDCPGSEHPMLSESVNCRSLGQTVAFSTNHRKQCGKLSGRKGKRQAGTSPTKTSGGIGYPRCDCVIVGGFQRAERAVH
jgi:hypothetical protein